MASRQLLQRLTYFLVVGVVAQVPPGVQPHVAVLGLRVAKALHQLLSVYGKALSGLLFKLAARFPVDHQDAAPGHEEEIGGLSRQRSADLYACARAGMQPVGTRHGFWLPPNLLVGVVGVELGADHVLEDHPMAHHQVRQGPLFGLPVLYLPPTIIYFSLPLLYGNWQHQRTFVPVLYALSASAGWTIFVVT